MPCLITGAAGFIGARLVERLRARGKDVISVDAGRAFADRPEHASIDFQLTIDRDELLDRLERLPATPTAIFHLGACTDTTEMDERKLARLNLEYSQALWLFASRAKIPFVYASSAATYGDGNLGYDDAESGIARLQPLNPYGWSKQRFDLWALERERAGEAPPSWSGFKFFNVYGFGERHKGKMASVALHAFDQIMGTGRARLFKSERSDFAHGHQARDFICVEDVIEVLTFALEKPIQSGIFNLGTGKARTFLDLVTAVFAALGKIPQVDFFEMPKVIATRYQYFTEARMEKLRKEGFSRPFTSVESGVAEYVRRLIAHGGIAHDPVQR